MASRGLQYLDEANKALKRFSLFSKTGKYEDAAENFQRAGNAFKSAQDWGQAGKAYLEAAQLQLKLKEEADAAANFTEAGHCFKHVDTNDAIEAFEEAIVLFNESGRQGRSAKLHQSIAEMCEADGNLEQAVEHYQRAGDLFKGDRSSSAANTTLEKVAQLSALSGNYSHAISAFEEIATDCLSKNLLKFNAKNHFMNALLCHLAQDDAVGAERALTKYSDQDYTFADSREGRLLRDLISFVAEGKTEDFVNAIASYDQISKLDPWRTKLLLTVRRSMPGLGGAPPAGAASPGVAGGGGGGDEDDELAGLA